MTANIRVFVSNAFRTDQRHHTTGHQTVRGRHQKLIFNAMSANVAERAVELGTLRAAGLSRGILARLVATENLLLTVIGIPLGLGTGTLVARWFMSTYTTEGYRWTLRMRPATFVLVTLGVLGASVLSQLPVLRGVRRIDVAHIVRERSL